jgi:gluconate 2-dehydrogenase gamma chain
MLGELSMLEFENMDRRSMMQSLALLLGAVSVPTISGCKAAMQGAGALDEAQMKLLTAIADTIIPETDTPGAVAANVPKLLSGMIRDWASAETRAELVGVIDAIGKKMEGDKSFAELDAAKRKALLAAYDADATKPGPPPKKKLSGFAAMVGGAPTMNPAYVKLKGLLINLYYNSEIACTKELVYEHVPGKWMPSLKVTPETRPFAGLGGPF